MESVLEQLSNFDVTPHPNNPNAEHPRFLHYKAKASGEKSSQDERRRRVLEWRKETRYDLLSHLRNIEENVPYNDDDESDMDIDDSKVIYKKPRRYCNFVMLSEWLVDVPEDFSEQYYAVPSPVGKRCLCVCYKGRASLYTKSGYRFNTFPSLLSGGSHKVSKSKFTVLDTLVCEKTRTVYIIDLMFWARQSYIDCDTSFRFEWLKSRVSELDDDVSVKSSSNAYSFLPMPFYNCDEQSLRSLFDWPLLEKVELDGVLFYHKDTVYTHGPSPLVCWLKPFMLPEMLGINVPETFMRDRPSHYKDITSHIDEYNRQREAAINERKNRKRNFKKNEKMDDAEFPTSVE